MCFPPVHPCCNQAAHNAKMERGYWYSVGLFVCVGQNWNTSHTVLFLIWLYIFSQALHETLKKLPRHSAANEIARDGTAIQK